MASNSDKALAVVTALPAKLHTRALLPKAKKNARKHITAIAQHETHAAFHAIQLGALLWQVKGAVKHGEFQPWIEGNIAESKYRACAYYMKLTLAFVEKVKLTADECLALPALKEKGAKAGTASKAFEKLEKFVGDLSLTDLLIKHGIKGVGLKGELTAGDDAPQNLSAAEQAQLELDLVWSQAYEPAKSLAELLAEKATSLTPDQRAALESELKKALQALRAA